MATFNETDLVQRGENLQRVRRDRLTSPNVAPAGFVQPGGEVLSVPGNIAPFARVPPFPTPFQDYGVVPTAIGFVLPATLNFPVLDVEEWRVATFSVSYLVRSANPSTVRITPLYGRDSTDSLVPKAVLSDTLTIDGVVGAHTIYQEAFQTPVLAASPVNFEFMFSLDVAKVQTLALLIEELNRDVLCNDRTPPDQCNLISLHYSLSM
jgi:hypothetical protein